MDEQKDPKPDRPTINAGHDVNIGGDVVGGDKIAGDQYNVADSLTIYQGLSNEEVRQLVDQLRQDGQPAVWDGRNPYLGLESYRESDAEFFFGRETLVQDLLTRVQRSNFITISGPSGSGKSSVARAGLFYALQQGRLAKSETWLLGAMQPRGNPFEELAATVSRLAKSPAAGLELLHRVAADPTALYRQLETLLSDDPRQYCVLLVDQFEEVFTQTKDEVARSAFIQLLTTAAQESERVKIVLSLRSDFVSNCAHYAALTDLMSQEFRLVRAMDARDLATAITLPALAVGVEIEPALVARIVQDMKGEEGALPLMSFALRDLFEAQKTRPGEKFTLTRADYLTRGGLEKALERHAKAVFKKFSYEQKELARSIFSKLIEVGPGRVDTRRTVLFQELVPAGQPVEPVEEVVRALAGGQVRLLTIDSQAKIDQETAEKISLTEATVTLAHEKLIEAWPWLRHLVDENRELIILTNEIANAAREWRENDQKDDFLYSGARLEIAEEQLSEGKVGLNGSSQAFFDAARARSRLIKRRNRSAISSLIVITLIAIFASIFAMNASQRSIARSLATQSQSAADREQFRLSVLLAIESQHKENSNQGLLWKKILSINTRYHETKVIEMDRAESVALSPRGDRLASASTDGVIKIWDITNGREMASLVGHNDIIYGLAWSPNGEKLASASNDCTVRIWIVNEKKEGAILKGHSSSVKSVSWSPDGKWLASVSWDKSIRIWNINNNQEAIAIKGLDSFLDSVIWSPNGELVAAGSADGNLYVWDARKGEQILLLRGHRGGIEGVSWSFDGKWLASGSWDRSVIIWNLDNKREEKRLEGHRSIVTTVNWSPDGQHLVSGSWDGTLRVWNIESGQEVFISEPSQGFIETVRWSPNGDHLLSFSSEGIVQIWEENEGPELIILDGHNDRVNAISWSPNGQALASASSDGSIRVWRVSAGGESLILKGHTDRVNSVAWSHDGRWLASGSSDETVRIWDGIDGREVGVLKGHNSFVKSVSWSSNGFLLASGSWDETVKIWDVRNQQEVFNLQGDLNRINTISLSPAGSQLAIGSWDGVIRILEEGLISAELIGHTSPILSVAWSPDGNYLSSASADKTVRIWDVNSAHEIKILEKHTEQVNAVMWSPTQEKLVSASSDGTVQIWNIGKGEVVATFAEIANPVTDVKWSPDGEHLASASDDGTIQIRKPKDPCQLIKSNLSTREWRTYIGSYKPYRPTCPNLPTPNFRHVSFWDDPFLTYGRWSIVAAGGIITLLICLAALWYGYRLSMVIARYLRVKISAGAGR